MSGTTARTGHYLLVEMPTPEEFLCGGRFRHPSRYRRKPSLSSLHQNPIYHPGVRLTQLSRLAMKIPFLVSSTLSNQTGLLFMRSSISGKIPKGSESAFPNREYFTL